MTTQSTDQAQEKRIHMQEKANRIMWYNFSFKTMAEVKEAIRDARDKTIREELTGGLFHSGEISLLITNADGDRLFDEPFWIKSVTQKSIQEAIIKVLDQLPEGTAFRIVTDAQIYSYDSLRDKFEGADAEPTGVYYNVTLVDFKG